MQRKLMSKAAHIVMRARGKRFRAIEEPSPMQKETGVCYYLYDKGLKDPQQQHCVIRVYASIKQWDKTGIREICILIQQDFPSFSQWAIAHIKQQTDEAGNFVLSGHCKHGTSSPNTSRSSNGG